MDVWALGVTTFILTFKVLPFKEDSDNILGLYDLIAKGEYLKNIFTLIDSNFLKKEK